MTDDVKTPNGGMKPWLRVLLVLSLAFNLLVVGALIGTMVSWNKWRPHHQARLEAAGGPLTRALSREDRLAIGKKMRKARRDGAEHGRTHHAELAGLVAELKAVPFDPAPVAERLRRHREAFDERFDLGLALLLERLTQMQPAQRAAYADRLQETLAKHRLGAGAKSVGE